MEYYIELAPHKMNCWHLYSSIRLDKYRALQLLYYRNDLILYEILPQNLE